MRGRSVGGHQQKQAARNSQEFKTLLRRLIRIAHLNRHLTVAATEMALKD
jgi:hypothetical protein